jgi:UDP-N-acetylmuramoylalanine--D-glutamate ligase
MAQGAAGGVDRPARGEGLPGAHNHQNACAAYAACRSLGIAPKLIEAARCTALPGLPHRSQTWANGRGALRE